MTTCPVCGEQFTRNTPHHKYCCEQCKDAAKNRRRKGYPIADAEYYAKFPPHAVCPVCEKPFERRRKDMLVCHNCVTVADNRCHRGQPLADRHHFDPQPIYYVYGWTETDANSENCGTFYIGKGSGRRAANRTRKKSPFAEAIRAVAEMKGTFAIVYFAKDLPEKDAYELESRLITEMRPSCNEQHNPDYCVE